mmetsp:Transcript_5808/g.10075  ORF Transcript_5808/g.10075 Transcript_5808/m.10075 type:complete len:231 (-) Transcript_5808:110-802(-)
MIHVLGALLPSRALCENCIHFLTLHVVALLELQILRIDLLGRGLGAHFVEDDVVVRKLSLQLFDISHQDFVLAVQLRVELGIVRVGVDLIVHRLQHLCEFLLFVSQLGEKVRLVLHLAARALRRCAHPRHALLRHGTVRHLHIRVHSCARPGASSHAAPRPRTSAGLRHHPAIPSPGWRPPKAGAGRGHPAAAGRARAGRHRHAAGGKAGARYRTLHVKSVQRSRGSLWM